ncbi:TPA: CatB-related O-acetyltransferase [Pseudomonas aeruginosa]|nr:CatB-related O-acetyltransferase [Pseudomonas aeruginosa]
MNIFREALLNRRLKKALARHGCRMASGVETLRDGTQVTLEPNVKLGKAKIHSPALEVGAYTDVVSGCEFLEVASIGRFCSIATGVVIGQPRRSHPMHWLSTHAFTANPKLLRKPLQPEREATPARIGHDVWIGRDALILDGVEIGTGAVIGAQSLVNRDVPPYAVVAGSPAGAPLSLRAGADRATAGESLVGVAAGRARRIAAGRSAGLRRGAGASAAAGAPGGAALAHPAQAVRHRMAVLRPAAAAGVDGGQGWISFRR